MTQDKKQLRSFKIYTEESKSSQSHTESAISIDLTGLDTDTVTKKLNELQILFRLAEVVSQDAGPAMIAEYNYLTAALDQLKRVGPQNTVESNSEEISLTPMTESVEEPMLITRIAVPESNPDVIAEVPNVATQVADSIGRQMATEGTVVRPEAEMPGSTAALEQKLKYLENWVSRIAATGPGGGAGDVVNLDYPVKTITVSSYTVLRRDHYLGVNVGTSTTITLPLTGVKQGRNLIVKDESGRCSTNRITLSGTVDSDTSGAILAIDNGALHLIYNNGWRIV